MRRWRPSIRLQIFAAVTTVAAVIIGGFSVLVFLRVQSRANNLAFAAAREDARLVALVATRGLESSAASLQSAVRGLRQSGALFRFGGGTRVQFYDRRGVRVFDSEEGEAATDEPPGDVRRTLAGNPLGFPFVTAHGNVAAAVAIEREGRPVGVVRVIKPALGVRSILADLAPEMTALAGGFVLFALLAALFVGRSLARPIRDLTATTRRIAAGNRAVALPEPRGREVADLSRAFDDMRRELEDKYRIERLTQDLSHELKNPVASIRSLTEALQTGAIADPEAGPRLVRRIDEAIQRLDAVVADLLALARIEARGVDRSATVDVPRLAREAIADAQSSRAGEVSLTTGEIHRRLVGDPVWLRRALANLLSNALDAGGHAHLCLEGSDTHLIITVANPGQVPEALRDHLFERFVSRRQDGTGLGLAIVRGVSEAHGGTAYLEEPGPPEVRIAMVLPW